MPDLRAHAAERGALPAADSATPNSRGHMPPNSSADSSSGVGCIGSDAAQQQLLLLRCCLRRRLRLLLRLRLCHRKRGFSQRESCRSENRCELLITCESRRRSTRHRLWRSCQHGARIKRLFSTRSPTQRTPTAGPRASWSRVRFNANTTDVARIAWSQNTVGVALRRQRKRQRELSRSIHIIHTIHS